MDLARYTYMKPELEKSLAEDEDGDCVDDEDDDKDDMIGFRLASLGLGRRPRVSQS